MRKTSFITEEFFRSFRKNLFKNILLMAVFSISLIAVVIMGSYYFDLGDRFSEATKQEGDRTWCDLGLISESHSEFDNSMTTVAGCYNMIKYYEAIHSSEDCPVISVDEERRI